MRVDRPAARRADRFATRREGSLAMVDHLLRGHPAPVNPYPLRSRRHMMFDWGTEQAARFCAPIRDYRR